MCQRLRTCHDCGAVGSGYYEGFEFEFYASGNTRCHRCPDCHERAIQLYARCTYGGFSSGYGDRRILCASHFGFGRGVSEYARPVSRGAA
jgi:hypothetical protein